jgi:uncharacterized protein
MQNRLKRNKGNDMNKLLLGFVLVISMVITNFVGAAEPNLDVDSPAIAAIKASMTARHSQLLPHYNSGAVGLTKDGFIAVKDATAVPLKDRGSIAGLVAAENEDRNKLYKEIAAGNGHPEWQNDIQNTFAGRWIDKAQSGWHYQNAGAWVKK